MYIINWSFPARQNGNFGRNFHLFSAHFPPIFRLWYPICRFSAHIFTDYAYFCLFSPIFHLFPPIFCLFSTCGTPILIINSSMLPICHFSTHMFTDSAYFPPIFRLFSAYFPPKIPPIFRPSCLAGFDKFLWLEWIYFWCLIKHYDKYYLCNEIQYLSKI